MSKKRETGENIHAEISGPISGQVAVGKEITQTQITGAGSTEVTEAELASLRQAFTDLRGQVEAQAPPETKEAALERVDELEKAVIAKEPDLTTMEYVKNWFAKNLPMLAGGVTGLIINPIVGKLVEAAGDTLADEFRRRFGQEDRGMERAT